MRKYRVIDPKTGCIQATLLRPFKREPTKLWPAEVEFGSYQIHALLVSEKFMRDYYRRAGHLPIRRICARPNEQKG